MTGLGSAVSSPLPYSGGWGWNQKLWGQETVSSSILLFRLWVIFHSILILHFPSLFLSFYSVPGANHLLSQPDFGLCQENLGSNQGLGWLDDLQIHGWESDSGTDIFLKPWSKSNLVMRRWLSWRTCFESTSLDSSRKCRTTLVNSRWNVSTVLWPEDTLNDFSLPWFRLLPSFPLFIQLHVHTCLE